MRDRWKHVPIVRRYVTINAVNMGVRTVDGHIVKGVLHWFQEGFWRKATKGFYFEDFNDARINAESQRAEYMSVLEKRMIRVRNIAFFKRDQAVT